MSWIQYHSDGFKSKAVHNLMANALADHPARPAFNLVFCDKWDAKELNGAKQVHVLKRLKNYKLVLWKDITGVKFIVEYRKSVPMLVASLDNCQRLLDDSRVCW